MSKRRSLSLGFLIIYFIFVAVTIKVFFSAHNEISDTLEKANLNCQASWVWRHFAFEHRCEKSEDPFNGFKMSELVLRQNMNLDWWQGPDISWQLAFLRIDQSKFKKLKEGKFFQKLKNTVLPNLPSNFRGRISLLEIFDGNIDLSPILKSSFLELHAEEEKIILKPKSVFFGNKLQIDTTEQLKIEVPTEDSNSKVINAFWGALRSEVRQTKDESGKLYWQIYWPSQKINQFETAWFNGQTMTWKESYWKGKIQFEKLLDPFNDIDWDIDWRLSSSSDLQAQIKCSGSAIDHFVEIPNCEGELDLTGDELVFRHLMRKKRSIPFKLKYAFHVEQDELRVDRLSLISGNAHIDFGLRAFHVSQFLGGGEGLFKASVFSRETPLEEFGWTFPFIAENELFGSAMLSVESEGRVNLDEPWWKNAEWRLNRLSFKEMKGMASKKILGKLFKRDTLKAEGPFQGQLDVKAKGVGSSVDYFWGLFSFDLDEVAFSSTQYGKKKAGEKFHLHLNLENKDQKWKVSDSFAHFHGIDVDFYVENTNENSNRFVAEIPEFSSISTLKNLCSSCLRWARQGKAKGRAIWEIAAGEKMKIQNMIPQREIDFKDANVLFPKMPPLIVRHGRISHKKGEFLKLSQFNAMLPSKNSINLDASISKQKKGKVIQAKVNFSQLDSDWIEVMRDRSWLHEIKVNNVLKSKIQLKSSRIEIADHHYKNFIGKASLNKNNLNLEFSWDHGEFSQAAELHFDLLPYLKRSQKAEFSGNFKFSQFPIQNSFLKTVFKDSWFEASTNWDGEMLFSNQIEFLSDWKINPSYKVEAKPSEFNESSREFLDELQESVFKSQLEDFVDRDHLETCQNSNVENWKLALSMVEGELASHVWSGESENLKVRASKKARESEHLWEWGWSDGCFLKQWRPCVQNISRPSQVSIRQKWAGELGDFGEQAVFKNKMKKCFASQKEMELESKSDSVGRFKKLSN